MIIITMITTMITTWMTVVEDEQVARKVVRAKEVTRSKAGVSSERWKNQVI